MDRRPLSASPLWTRGQHVAAAELPNAVRVSLADPAPAPAVELMREEDRTWEPRDYASLPARLVHGPGYTLLREVFLTAPGMALAVDGRFVDDPLTRLVPAVLSPSFERLLGEGAATRSNWPPSSRTIDRGILVSGPGMRVYGHHLLDFLPAVAALDEFGALLDWPLLVPENYPAWALAMAAVFSPDREVIRSEGGRRRRTRVGELCVPWLVREPRRGVDESGSARAMGAFHPIAAELFDRAIRAAIAPAQRSQPASGKLLVLRDPAGPSAKRRLANVDRVVAAFERRGFECIVPSVLRFSDQVRRFADAAVVAGEAGSGLHGTVFSRPATTTLELRPPTYATFSQPAIAALKGHRFASVAGSQSATEWMSPEPWTLDPATLDRRLSDLGL